MSTIRVTINGDVHEAEVEPRLTLADFIREEAGLKGTHIACEHGFCGNCNVSFDGATIRSCLMFAVQAEGAEVTTIEGIAPPGELGPVQEAFRQEHGLQCGFCTPGFIISVHEFLRDNPTPTREEVLEGLSGNLCRCTGYQGIIRAVERAAKVMAE